VKSYLICITLISFSFALVVFVTNLFCAWFKVAAQVVHIGRGGFCRDVVVWQCEVMRLHFGVKEWHVNKVG
jgi:hypothetical protein